MSIYTLANVVKGRKAKEGRKGAGETKGKRDRRKGRKN